jgi:hypothetical protein
MRNSVHQTNWLLAVVVALLGVLLTRCTGYSENVYYAPDVTAPKVKLYLGTDPQNDPCKENLVGHENVSARLLPFNLCAMDPAEGGYTSGLGKVCLKVGDTAVNTIPLSSDECWKERSEILPLVMLKQGRNTVTAFAKDLAGNISSDSATVTLNLSVPPEILVVSPTPSMITASPWAAGSSHQVEFRVSDDDTPASDIKLIVSLLDLDTKSRFVHLGCNFSNSVLWKQCPKSEIENSPEFTKPDADGKFRFTVNVPAGWDSTRRYVVSLTAIDKSGNAAIASTQEVNVGYEVIAGKTYRGIGGSPTRLQRQGESTILAVDRKGSLFLTNEGIKIDPFDRRTCRLFRTNASDLQPFDCSDSITHDFRLSSDWVYDSQRDIFLTQATRSESGVVRNYIVEIDFAAKSVTPIFGGPSKLALTSNLPAGALSSDYSAASLNNRLAFEGKTGRTFFLSAGQIFTIDRDKKLKYLAGTPGGQVVPLSVAGIALKDIALTSESVNVALAVTRDGRLFINSGPEATWSKGSGWGVQYILEAPALESPDEIANLIRLTPTNASQLSPDRGVSGLSRPAGFDPVKNRLYAAIAWWTHAYLEMPAKGSPAASYVWTYFTRYEENGKNDNNMLGEGPLDVTFPLRYAHLGVSAAFVSEEFLYTTGATTGSVTSFDLAAKTMERQVGFGDLEKGNMQLGANIKVDSPISLCLNGNSVYFNDYAGLKQITLDTTPNGAHSVDAIKPGFAPFPFKCDFDENRLYSLAGRDIAIHNLLDLSAVPAVKTNTAIGYAYTGTFGLSNSFINLKRIFTSSSYDPIPAVFFKAWMSYAEYSATAVTPTVTRQLTARDQFANDVSYCPSMPDGKCAQGPLTAGSYDSDTYRIEAYFSQSQRRYPFGMLAFDSTDTYAYGCQNGRFVQIDPVNRRITPFNVTAGTTALSCTINSGIFNQRDGRIYYSRGNSMAAGVGRGVYILDVSTVSTGTVAATLVSTRSAMPTGVYSDFIVTPDHVYISDRTSARIMRAPR